MFYKTEGESIVFSGKGYLVFYVPEVYFTSKCNVTIGEYISALGICNYELFNENGKSGGLKLFNFPSIFITQPGEVERVKDLKLTENSEKQDYRLLKYREGDKIIVHKRVPQDVENVSTFFRLFIITGNSPDTISYDIGYRMYLDTMHINGGAYNISNQFFGIMQSELYRDPTDKTRPFRLSKAKKNKEWTNYSVISVKEIPNYISPFVSLTSEVFDDSIIQAIMMPEKSIKSSPLERALTGEG